VSLKWLKLLVLGAVVAGLYAMLFTYEQEVIRLCGQGGWYFLFPVSVAFVFSIFHGAFTGLFWDTLGVRPKPKAASSGSADGR
jgi:hypothetical protein